MSIEYLDGRRFRQAVVAGADWVRHRRDHINRINVFPVADGDTGTNMALTLSATATAIRAATERHLGAVASRAAEASILGAKGNSGVILAHWFLGISRAFGDAARAGPHDVSVALRAGTEAVYAAMDEPVEGTIISVMRAVSESVDDTETNLGALLERMVEIGRDAVARTPEQLAVLREAHVVDAGAQGYVNFLEGAARAVQGKSAPATDDDVLEVDFAHAEPGEIAERFCTEVVLRGRRLEEGPLRRSFRPLGSALLVVTTGEVCKLHIHTNHPDEVMRVAARFGDIEERKVDDMLRQRDERATRTVTPLVPLEEQAGNTVAVVCDSTADLPAPLRRELGMEQVPLQVLFGDKVFRDQVDLDTETFYELLESEAVHPSTSQPAPRAFVEAFDRLRAERPVLVVTLSQALSGTYQAALAGARLATQPRVEVFDSGTISLGLGLMAANAARLAARRASMEELLAWLEHWRSDSGMVFTLANVEYLRRGGRIGAARGLLGRLLGMRPILTIRDGKVAPLGRARGAREQFDRVVAVLEHELEPGAPVRLGLVEIGPSAELDRLEALMRDRYDVVECVRGAPTGVVGAHAGPGAWGLFYQRVREDDPLRAAAL